MHAIRNDSFVGDGLDSDFSIKGTTNFWGGPDDDCENGLYSHGRECSNCGERLSNRARGNLCVSCRNRAKSTDIQAKVAKVVALDRRKKAAAAIGAWWQATDEPVERVSLRVVGINLSDVSTEAALERLAKVNT